MQLFKYVPLAWSEELSDTERELFLKRCECIRNNRFWFAKPETLNDPYDCNPAFKSNNDFSVISVILEDLSKEETALVLKIFPNCQTKDDIYKLIMKIKNSADIPSDIKDFVIWNFQGMVSRLVRVKIANTGILCFSTDPIDIKMWTHYANNHKGICLEIEIPKDTRSLKKVIYTKEQPYLDIHEAMSEKYGKLLEIFYTKSIRWRHEKEWRMVSLKGDIEKEIPGTNIKQIIYGIQSSEETKAKINELIEKSIPLNQLKMKRNYVLDYSS
jgi:hypothetical protein